MFEDLKTLATDDPQVAEWIEQNEESYAWGTRRYDVYAASMIFYQLFCFRQPFYGINPVDAAKMASIDALRPTMSKNLMPPDLARVIRLMWDPDDQRRPTFPQIIQILEPLAEKYQQEDKEIAAGGKCCVIQ